jgi:hypothetical protein
MIKILLWIGLVLLLLGDAFFVLPYHYTEDNITTSYFVNYKKDSPLLKNVFADSAVHLRLTMPPLYDILYRAADSGNKPVSGSQRLFVNIAVSHNLDFTALVFPYYKVASFNSIIPFYSIIKASNKPDMDSTALIGNITISGKLTVKGICTPVYARSLVEKELIKIMKREMDKVEQDINRPADTSSQGVPGFIAPPPARRERKSRKQPN